MIAFNMRCVYRLNTCFWSHTGFDGRYYTAAATTRGSAETNRNEAIVVEPNIRPRSKGKVYVGSVCIVVVKL